MNFDFTDEQRELRDQAERVLQETCDARVVRGVLESDAPYDKALWAKLGELGWMGAAIPESYGGVGLGHVELAVIAEQLGRHVAPAPFASTVYLLAEALMVAGTQAQKRAWLQRIAAGEVIGALAVAEGPRRVTPANLSLRAADGRLFGEKTPVADGDVADVAIVLAEEDGGASLFLAVLGDGVTRGPAPTIDPTRSHAALKFDGAPAERLGEKGGGWALLDAILARAATLMAFEQIGGAQAALDQAKAYAMDRYAFGRQIASFQAIKHKLADVYIAIEIARSNAYYAAWALANDAPDLPVAAAAARVAASQAYEHAAKENIQTHGGMGFTWEFDCHLHLRRAKLLSLTLGATRVWKDRLIDALDARNAA